MVRREEEEWGTGSLMLYGHGRDLFPSLFRWDLALQKHRSGSKHLPEGNKPDRYFAQIIIFRCSTHPLARQLAMQRQTDLTAPY